MASPNYIVNLYELAKIIQDTLKYDKTIEYKGLMCAKGFTFKKESKDTILWKPEQDLILTGVKIKYEDNRNIGKSLRNAVIVWKDDSLILDNYSMKESDDFVKLRQFTPVEKGSEIRMELNEFDIIETNVSIIFEYISVETIATKVDVLCVNIDLEEDDPNYIIKKENRIYFPTQVVTIEAPKIHGFENVGKTQETIEINIETRNITIIFEYKTSDKLVIVSHMSTRGIVLDQFEEYVTPPTTAKYEFKEFLSHSLISDKEVEVNINIEDKGIIEVFFYYEPTDKYISIKCIDSQTDLVLKRDFKTIEAYPATIFIEAPTIEGYKVLGDRIIEKYIDDFSPSTTYLDFYYIPDKEQEIEHGYDYKVTLRWENNSPVDLDLHMTVNNDKSTEVSFMTQAFENSSGKMWLDYDYTSQGVDGFNKTPEIGTLEGFEGGTLNVFIVLFNRHKLTKEANIDIFYNDKGKELKIANYLLDPQKMNRFKSCKVCDIDISNKVAKEILYYG